MRSIYNNSAKKYEEIVKNIITDQDAQHIDFPLISVEMQQISLKSMIP